MTATDLKPSARDNRRQAIVQIAREVFMAEGYAAASMSAIAARLGGSKGTLYNYFRSKEDLFTAFIGDECESEAVAAFAIDGDGRDVARTLQSLGLRVTTFLMSDKVVAIHRLVIAEAERFPELGRTLYQVGPKQRVANLALYFETAMAEGRLKRREGSQHAAEQFLALCRAGVRDRRLWNLAADPTPEEIRENVESAVGVFMAAYGPDGR